MTPQRLKWGLVCALTAAALTPHWSDRFGIAVSRLRAIRGQARSLTTPADAALHQLADDLIDAAATPPEDRMRERRRTELDRLGMAQRLALEHVAELMAVHAQQVEEAAEAFAETGTAA